MPALRAAEVLPGPAGWRRFIDRLLLALGSLLVAAGVIFFIAYNWRELGRFAKFGLVEALIVVALTVCWKFGLERPAGKAALGAAALLAGGLLALVGQTYQTGADTWELFFTWAALILPWMLVGRHAVLWVGWLVIANLAAALYFITFRGFLWWLGGPRETLWALFALDTAALAVWELARRGGVAWLQERWPARLLVLASGASIALLAMIAIFEHRATSDTTALLGWALWIGAAYWIYRRLIVDLFALAVGVFSVIVVVSSWLAHHLGSRDAGGFLLISLVVIGLAAGGALWLRRTAEELAP